MKYIFGSGGVHGHPQVMSGAWLLQNVAVVATIIVVLVSDGGVVARQDTSCGKESESGFKPGHRREPSHEDDDVTGRHNTWRFSRGDCKRKLGKVLWNYM